MFAAWMIKANTCDPGANTTRLAQWRQVEKTTGKKPQSLLDMPDCPRQLLYLWELFTQVAGEKLTYVEVEAYAKLMREPLSPFEVSILFQLESVRNGER